MEKGNPPELAHPLYAVLPPGLNGKASVIVQFGMTLRDYFAAQALVGILHNRNEFELPEARTAATAAYEYADAMMQLRKPSNENA